jgi:hypothetical protein
MVRDKIYRRDGFLKIWIEIGKDFILKFIENNWLKTMLKMIKKW